ncbi:MAG: SUMF1/EgtB/PvdO family nonheme iron enzyme [Gammaproteobacteria bacterium]|nr:SUMF1/EgtB/PvdO family nonheme iron enzyme [Gammaproteobacteria bacterium]
MLKEINKLSSREAMHLPAHYQSSILENVQEHLNTLKCQSIDELMEIIASQTASLHARYAAATLLSFLGDPRIDPNNPAMITIPGACIPIGSTLEEIQLAYDTYQSLGVQLDWLLKENPKHLVTLSSFRIAKYPVTNYEYLVFLKETQHDDLPTAWQFGIYDFTKSNHPVYGIQPKSADNYAAWISEKTKRSFRLPTEYEWEYAAAGPNRNEFPWGNIFSTEHANTLESSIYSTTPIGIYSQGQSYFGCYDMAGNVEEYVASNYFTYPGGKDIRDDLSQPDNYRVARGGSFTRHADLARCRRRHGFYNKPIYTIGFRLAETL